MACMQRLLQRKTATDTVMNKLSCFYGLGVYWGIKILLFQLIPYGFYPPVDILPGDFRTDGFCKGHTVGRKAVHSAESGIQ